MESIDINGLKQILLAIRKKFQNKDDVFYRFGLSSEVLRILIDNEWVNQSIFSALHPNKSNQTEEPKNYLKSKFKNEEQEFQWQNRVEVLAEMVFNLQDISNFLHIVNKIKQGNFLSRFAELEIGAHLKKRKVNFEYVAPSNKKTQDFDILINEAISINCDVKHKLEETGLTKSTLDNTFYKVSRQLPKNSPALIGLKIPEKWVRDKNAKKLLTSAIKKFFRRNTNMLAVLIRWEERNKINEFYQMFRLEINNQSHFLNSQGLEILNKIKGPQAGDWVRFSDFIRKKS